ncbi:carboxy methyl transferase for protein phosphatase 2A [Tilletia horrida]|uniref:Leucine carboxyl methyltransferase 1 n=1 Tax=Tilletia horrida TaxID=155126 RepID=A0AAN6GX97_9BASI|nr:carboxy methyl transferase for protein phosphatase 2A [Tilletia horrida]KAK0570324.1 carboxy methyl transferase for protein phosphatase 2A [Tilletia horrida]
MDRTGSVGPGHGLIGSAPPLRNPLAAAAEEEDLDPSARRRQQQLQAQQDALALRDERMPPAPSSAGPSSRLTLGAPRMRKAPGSSSSSSTTSFVSSDAAVRATDSDALISRLSALDAGYLDPDPFASLFLLPVDAPGAAHTKALTTRRPPVLNIGTYLRCSALDRVISTLLKQSGQVEDGAGLHIISIGAGSDSRFWRLQSDPALRGRLAHYTELDFKEITKAKIHSIQRSNILQDVIMSSNQGSSTGPSIEVEAGVLKSRRYSLFPCDLRTLAQEKKAPTATDNEGSTETATAEQIRAHIRTMSKGKQRQCDNVDDAMGVDQNNTEGQGVDWRPNEAIGRCPRRRPKTLILAECVLAYLEPRDADALLSWFATLAAPSLEDDGRATREGSDVMVLSFDMCVEGSGRGDREGGGRFGRMMLQNIEHSVGSHKTIRSDLVGCGN